MTRPVAEQLAGRVFCILDDPKDDSRRMTASEFGIWARDLPALLGGQSSSSMQRTISASSTHGHRISSSIPISHRPISRHPSGSTSAMRTPAIQSRSLSRAPSLGPAYEKGEASELSTVFDQDIEEDEDNDPLDLEGMTSRSTSTNKRRKRGARKGKGAAAPPTTTKDETLASLAIASQSLAREISKASKSSSHRSVSTKTSTLSSRRFHQPFEPVSMYALPTPLLTASSSVQAVPHSSYVPTVPVPAPVTKKPSKWKLSFGKNSTASVGGRVSPVEEVSPPTSLDLGGSQPMSATASNVTNLIMGLSAPSTHSSPPSSNASRSDDGSSTWGRGRRARGTPVPSYVASSSPHSSIESWAFNDRRSERAVSPNSTRSGRPVASSASSVVSGNWRSSMSTTSSAGTSTSAFTRYSNSSARSISTTATSVSSASWRASVKSTPSTTSNHSGYTNLPKNIKRKLISSPYGGLSNVYWPPAMNGVPWELDQLPRGQHPNPVGDIFGSPPVRKQRTRKPKDVKLDTITERPANSGAQKTLQYQRQDASTSTTDLSDGDGCKKVQRGQINALAKMLSALRR